MGGRTNSLRISPKHGVNPSVGVCFWCGEDDGTVLLAGKMKSTEEDSDPEAPRRMCASLEPCKQCEENMALGITLMEATDEEISRVEGFSSSHAVRKPVPTGRWWVLKEDAIRRLVQPPELVEHILKAGKSYIDPETAKSLGLTEEDE
jgi:hypothetical protein